MPITFSFVSLIYGKIGVIHTTVGIPASLNLIKVSTLSFVVETFGKICQGHKQNFFDKFISSLFLS